MNKAKFLFPAILFAVTITTASFSQEGEKLFKGNCGVCHTVGKGKLVGPDLKGCNTRYDEAWLKKWIKSSQALVKTGDKKAVQLFNDNANLVMPDQALTDAEIKSVLTFIQEKEKSTEVASSQRTSTDKSASPPNNTGHNTSHNNNTLLSMFGFSGYMMIMLMGLLIIVLWVMSMALKK